MYSMGFFGWRACDYFMQLKFEMLTARHSVTDTATECRMKMYPYLRWTVRLLQLNY